LLGTNRVFFLKAEPARRITSNKSSLRDLLHLALATARQLHRITQARLGVLLLELRVHLLHKLRPRRAPTLTTHHIFTESLATCLA